MALGTHTSTCRGGCEQGRAHAEGAMGRAVAGGARCPGRVFLLLPDLGGARQPEQRLPACLACSLRGTEGLRAATAEARKPGRQAGGGRETIRLACGAAINLRGLKGGQSSELSKGNKGPGVGSSESCISLSGGWGARDQEP